MVEVSTEWTAEERLRVIRAIVWNLGRDAKRDGRADGRRVADDADRLYWLACPTNSAAFLEARRARILEGLGESV